MASPVKIDLPITEVTSYLEGLLEELGIACIVNGTVSTKVMISDLQKTYNNLQENSKQAVISKTIDVKRGDKIILDNGTKSIVYTIPNDDIVSYSMKILICNAEIDVFKSIKVYAENGDIISQDDNVKCTIDGFIERITAREKQYDVGILHEAILRFVTYVGEDMVLGDIVEFKNKKYKVIDIDDITDGLLVIQLASVRQ